MTIRPLCGPYGSLLYPRVLSLNLFRCLQKCVLEDAYGAGRAVSFQISRRSNFSVIEYENSAVILNSPDVGVQWRGWYAFLKSSSLRSVASRRTVLSIGQLRYRCYLTVNRCRLILSIDKGKTNMKDRYFYCRMYAYRSRLSCVGIISR